MTKIDLSLIQELRQRTGTGIMDCRKALEETGGDMEKAVIVLRKKGAAVADKRAGHATDEGIIHAYIHPGARLGVMVQVECETDFVARNEEFKQFAQNLCLHITAFNPKFISQENVDQALIDQEKALYIEELTKAKKPAGVIDQIVEGKLKKLYSSICLIKHPYVKNDQITVEDALQELMAKFGEKIRIKRFARFEIGN